MWKFYAFLRQCADFAQSLMKTKIDTVTEQLFTYKKRTNWKKNHSIFRPSDKHVDNSFMSKLCIGTYHNNLIVVLSDQEEEKWLSCCRSLDRGTGATKYYSNSATVTWRRVDKIRNSYASRLSRVFNSIISIQNIQKIPIFTPSISAANQNI